MTTYEYFQNEATFNRDCAKKAQTKTMHDSFLADAEKWESRAGKMTPTEATVNFDEVILWRLIETLDQRTVNHV